MSLYELRRQYWLKRKESAKAEKAAKALKNKVFIEGEKPVPKGTSRLIATFIPGKGWMHFK